MPNSPLPGRDDKLRLYATDRQWECLEAYWGEGSVSAAGRLLNVSRQVIQHAFKAVLRRAAKGGYAPDYDMTKEAPPGFHVKGVSSYYREGELVGQWVKSEADRQHLKESFDAAIEEFKAELRPYKPIPVGKHFAKDLLAAYPIPDHHIGMLSWHEETGENYDLKIAEKLLVGAIAYLAEKADPAEHALLAALGDLMHYDTFQAVTPQNKNVLDSDGRYPEMVRTVIRCIRQIVTILLKKHKYLTLIFEPGNHDPSSTIFLMEMMAAVYENEPRVSVDTTPRHFHYYRHGKVLLGTHHGDKTVKLQDLGAVMAADRPEDWGQTKHRVFWTGHVHHDRVIEVRGCKIESMRILAPADAWAHSEGYRAGRDIKMVLFHKELGETQRITVNPDMLL